MSDTDCHLFLIVFLFIFADRYEVLFFDGFTKNVKGIRMSKLEGEAAKIEEVKVKFCPLF